jgi:hypothetical protein
MGIAKKQGFITIQMEQEEAKEECSLSDSIKQCTGKAGSGNG